MEGGEDDGGLDDDPETDDDIEFYRREFATEFDGEPVNQLWYLVADDCDEQDLGFIDQFEIWVYYEVDELYQVYLPLVIGP